MSRISIIAGLSLSAMLSQGLSGQVVRVPGTPAHSRGFAEKSQVLDRALFLRIPKVSADYLLGSGDEMKIEVVGHDDLNRALQSVKISTSGQITVPFLGAIQAADLTASQLETEIGARLRQRELIQDPEVMVFVTDYQAKPIYVVGEVDNPGEYMMSQQLTLMEAILMAGGLDFTADRYGYLHRRTAPQAADWRPEPVLAHPELSRPGREVIQVDLQPLKNGGVLQPDIKLQKGDVFAVPRRLVQLFYVVGEVRSPGGYEIAPPVERSMLVSQAIAQAGGPNQTAKLSRAMLVRYDDQGKRQERKVDIAAILKGTGPDFQIRPNDIVFIPGSTAKTIEYGLLGALPAAAQVNAQSTIQTAGRSH